MNLARLFLLGLLPVLLSSCAARRDDSRYVALGTKRGYYIVEPGSPWQEKLGHGLAPVKDTASPLHRGSGSDVIAFRFNRAGVLSAPPVYLSQLQPERVVTSRLAIMKQGQTTWPQVRRMFPPGNQIIRQPDGGWLVYHEIPIYNSLEESLSDHGSN